MNQKEKLTVTLKAAIPHSQDDSRTMHGSHDDEDEAQQPHYGHEGTYSDVHGDDVNEQLTEEELTQMRKVFKVPQTDNCNIIRNEDSPGRSYSHLDFEEERKEQELYR